ncbi:hypothetical protein MMC14_003057 [Varicellaria rhodocarpa]|nr:hypothetical protein [Varicellaria rhodocarpa]
MSTSTQTITPLTLTSEIPKDSTYVPSGPVTSTLSFYSPPADGAAPYYFVEKQPEGVAQTNFGVEHVDVELQDIRGKESSFSLANNSFATVQNIISEEKDFTDDEHIKAVYYPEVEQTILKNVPGAKRVILFDHTIRRAEPNAHRAPVKRVHVDQTPASAMARVKLHLPDEADTLLKSRYRIINVWRPLNGPVQSYPLGFADSSSINDEDLVSVQHRYPDRTGATAGVRHSSSMRWHYWSGMENSDRLLLQCSDSENDTGRAPHTAFEDPRTPEGAVGRESIEVRALVFG